MEPLIEQIIKALIEKEGLTQKEADLVIKIQQFREFPPKGEWLTLWNAEEWANLLLERFEKPSSTAFKEAYVGGVMEELENKYGYSKREAWDLVIGYGIWELFDKEPREVQQISYENMARAIVSTQK